MFLAELSDGGTPPVGPTWRGWRFGFRPSGDRRETRVQNPDYGELEVSMVLSLMSDPGSVPNPTRGHAAANEGPLR